MSELLQVFSAELMKVRVRQQGKQNERWRHRNAVFDSGHRCVYCGLDVVRLALRESKPESEVLNVDHFIPQVHGGPHIGDNLIAACASCNSKKRDRDWLEWRHAPSKEIRYALDAHRLRMLAYSQNHLIRDTKNARKKVTVLKRLGSRWALPRFPVWAALTGTEGLIGWAKHEPQPPVAAASVMCFGARLVSRDPVVWSVDHARFHDAVWTLIDLNSWVRRLDLGSQFADPTPVDDGDSRWFESSANINWLVRRRNRLPTRKGVDTRPTLAGWRPSALLKATSYSLR
jgi:hypothetical protein